MCYALLNPYYAISVLCCTEPNYTVLHYTDADTLQAPLPFMILVGVGMLVFVLHHAMPLYDMP